VAKVWHPISVCLPEKAATGKGNIWRSQDGGKSWQNILKQPGTYFRAIGMVDARHGFAGNIGTDYYPRVTDNTPLYETKDGGDHWAAVTHLPGPTMRGICAIVDDKETMEFGVGFANADLGWVGTTKGGFETRDGGLHWERVELGRAVNKFRILMQGQHFTAFAIGSDVYKYTSEQMPAVQASSTPVAIDKP